MSGAARWLAAACALAACGDALADRNITFPGCPTQAANIYDFEPVHMEVVQPGQTDINVTGLYLTSCNFTTLNLERLRGYPNLKYIQLFNIEVTNLKALTFDYLTNLQQLTLQKSLILGKDLPSNIFRNCRRLRHINFSSNDMRDTPAELLQGLDLNTLFLSGCSLLEVPSFFTSQVTTFANLTYLGLSFNNILNLHTDLIKPLTKIRAISLNANKLRNIPEAFFQYKPFLESINLCNNQIENIPLNAFLGTKLKSLYLNGNRLTVLPPNFISNLQATGISLEKFRFYNNPWECACLNNLMVRMKNLNIDYSSIYFNGRRKACRLRQMLFQYNNCY